ncbi:site-specific integrase [Algoriphagus resistens]|uniref:site-specific integrase n=1 Tax=Algoriphagus resistens TaxID=1750590 RepID=UPI0007167AB9|nr:site-specific integrase [Algoriphagus resistens]
MVKASSKIIYNPQRIRKDGTVLLYLRVIINREKKDIDLKILWPCERFDVKNQKCLPREKNDQLCEDYNLIIKNELAKATEIFVKFRLRRLDLTLDLFLREYHSQISTEDFYKYYKKKVNLRYRAGEIAEPTRNNHLGTLRKLKQWKPKLSFFELDAKTAQNFDSWMLRKTPCKSLNGRACHHKNFKSYVRAAIQQDEIQCINPYHFFKAKTEMGRFQPLTKDQFLQFWDYYQDPLIHPTHRAVLRAFLFCCVTGMRHGDVRRFSLDWIDGEFFDFIPHKTRRWGTRVRMPITKEALDLIADEIDEIGDTKMFRYPSEQKQNDFINEISDLLEIKQKICFQIGRETFATLYMEHDGKLEVLASFMGHTSTKMSEKYVKIMDQRSKAEGMRISRFMVRD